MAVVDGGVNAIVIDNGSRWIKAGFAGDDTCSFVFRNVIGRLTDQKGHGSVIGYKAREMESALLDHPVERGIIVKWDEMEEIWRHLFLNEMKINPEEYKTMLTQPLFNPAKNKERTAQIMYEQFNVPALFLANQSSLALYSSGRLDGLVLDIGDGITATAPVIQGFSKANAMKRLDISGRDLTEYLLKILSEKGRVFSTYQLETVNKIKEASCFVSADTGKEISPVVSYELPGGEKLKLGEGAYMCPESLFQPALLNDKGSGIHEMICDSIAEMDPNLHEKLYSNIILSGASTMLRGVVERIENELRQKAPENMKPFIKIIAPPERNKSTFLGGSILASLDNFQSMWASKQDYEEIGPNVVAKM